jgi:hypothetical protein
VRLGSIGVVEARRKGLVGVEQSGGAALGDAAAL